MSGAGRRIYLNGALVEAEAARIDPADRGLLLGDGLFETLLALDGRIVALEPHLARLRAGAAELGIDFPDLDLAEAAQQTLAANRLQAGRAALRITLTRGTGPRGLLPPAPAAPTLMIAATATPAPAESPLRAVIASTRRNEQSPLSRLKSLAYLDNVLARREAAARGTEEAVLLNTAGHVACTTIANLFVVRDGRLLTPPLSDGVLPGIVRAAVLDLARAQGITVEERSLDLEALTTADEAFVTNSLMALCPLASLDGRAVGSGEAGPMTTRLARAYADSLR